jgi:hypothetical protein
MIRMDDYRRRLKAEARLDKAKAIAAILGGVLMLSFIFAYVWLTYEPRPDASNYWGAVGSKAPPPYNPSPISRVSP